MQSYCIKCSNLCNIDSVLITWQNLRICFTFNQWAMGFYINNHTYLIGWNMCDNVYIIIFSLHGWWVHVAHRSDLYQTIRLSHCKIKTILQLGVYGSLTIVKDYNPVKSYIATLKLYIYLIASYYKLLDQQE